MWDERARDPGLACSARATWVFQAVGGFGIGSGVVTPVTITARALRPCRAGTSAPKRSRSQGGVPSWGTLVVGGFTPFSQTRPAPQVCDFGLARLYGDPIKKMTPGVVTLWYRSPEILLGEESYDPAVDLWSVGCIFAEMLQKEPLFPGKTEVDMLTRIFNTLGTPTEDTWPDFNKVARGGFDCAAERGGACRGVQCSAAERDAGQALA